MRTPLLLLLIALILTAYVNGLPYNHTPSHYTSQQSVQWSHDNQEYQQEHNNSFLSVLPEQEIIQIGTGWDQSNSPLYISSSSIIPGFISQNAAASGFINSPQFVQEEELNEGGLTLSCNGENSICVHKDHCVNGYVHSVSEEYIHSKKQIQQCNLQYEVCCIVNTYHDQSSPPVVDISHVALPEAELHHIEHVIDDQRYVDDAQSNQHNIFTDFQNGVEQSVASPSTDIVPDRDINSGVAVSPSVTESSGTSFEEASKEAEGSDIGSTQIRPPSKVPSSESTSFQIPIQSGCAAALLCVEEQFCTKEGVISTQPVILTQKDILRRVPLSSCRDPTSGIIGKCCRDPNYVDPWPTGNLPANYSGGFDEQGFPTFLNIAKVRPPKKQISGTKKIPTVKPSVRPPTSHYEFSTIKTPTTQEPIQQNKNENYKYSTIKTQTTQEHIGQYDNENYKHSTIKTSTGDAIQQYENNYETPEFSINIPQQITVPPFPSQNPLISTFAPSLVPRPFSKNDYESHVKDSLPIIPQYTEYECGVRHNVLHTDKSDKPVTSFGEIPWQAMILSHEYRNILCSGVIISSHIILTTAHCINGIPVEQLGVKTGEWKLGYELENEEPLPFKITNVSSIVIHPHYVLGSSINDVAALLLEHDLAYNRHINPLCLPNVIETQTPNRCIVTGWGQAVIKVHALGAIMNSLDINVLSHDLCEQYASQQKYKINVEHGTVCVKPQNINHNMCQTEIGSPLACETENGVYELVGLYSQDNGCSPTNQVAVFTPIDNDWLNKIMHITLNSNDDSHDYRKSNFSSATNQYLPPL